MCFAGIERIALFIDGASLYATACNLGIDIDYKKLLSFFRGKDHLVRAFYYIALSEDQQYTSIQSVADWLDYNGFTIVKKPTKEFTDSTGQHHIKRNMDIELAVDMFRMVDYMDHAVLFSGDGDFRCLVEAVQRKGVRVTVVSTMCTDPPVLADELRRQADNFMDLQEISSQISIHPDTDGYTQPTGQNNPEELDTQNTEKVDTLSMWIEDQCILEQSAEEHLSTLFENWRYWIENRNMSVGNKENFSRRLWAKGFVKFFDKTAKQTKIKGLQLNPHG